MSTINSNQLGASARAIQIHYDVDNEFYKLWLDESLTYSAALWKKGDDLDAAQIRKLDIHASNINAADAKSVLDIGCGWGGMLDRLLNTHGVENVVGLTLSKKQKSYNDSRPIDGRKVLLEGWENHSVTKPYDGIISIGAFEHFARPEMTSNEKIEAYRAFFGFCHDNLKHGKKVSLQTITYENWNRSNRSELLTHSIFPESELPFLSEIVESVKGLFEVQTLYSDRIHYAATLKVWLKNLRANREIAIEMVGEEIVLNYEKYLKLSTLGFLNATFNLARIRLSKIG